MKNKDEILKYYDTYATMNKPGGYPPPRPPPETSAKDSIIGSECK